jgi:hypothetical protein
MTAETPTAPPDTDAPAANRVGPVMPENLTRLLIIVRTLLHFGRHFTALIDRRADRRGFWLFSAVFGARKRAVMRASLHRGLLRAAALEALLLSRAATGRDVTAPRLTPAVTGRDVSVAVRLAPAATGRDVTAARLARTTSGDDVTAATACLTRTTSGAAPTHPCNEPFRVQIERLGAERARHDAPVDPRHPATAEAIEAEVLARSIGRTIADIRRDLGIVAMMCTTAFWDAMTDAIAGYQDGTAAERLDASPLPEPELMPQQAGAAAEQQRDASAAEKPGDNCATAQLDQRASLYPLRPSQCALGSGRRIIAFRRGPPLAKLRENVPKLHRYAGVFAAATGPPPLAAMRLAA